MNNTYTDPMQGLAKWLVGFAVVVFFLVLASYTQGQTVHGFVESYNKIDQGKVTPQINALVYGPLKGKLGWSVWSLTSEGYSEATISLTLRSGEMD